MTLDGVELVNSIEYLDFDRWDDEEPCVQVIVCEQCGTVRCSGNWVSSSARTQTAPSHQPHDSPSNYDGPVVVRPANRALATQNPVEIA